VAKEEQNGLLKSKVSFQIEKHHTRGKRIERGKRINSREKADKGVKNQHFQRG